MVRWRSGSVGLIGLEALVVASLTLTFFSEVVGVFGVGVVVVIIVVNFIVVIVVVCVIKQVLLL